MRFTVFRHAAYDTPWRALPSPVQGRFHRAGQDIVQYLSLHPLGPAAEMLRHNLGPDGDLDDVLLNLWTATVEVDGVTRIDFDDCAAYGITADQLVGEDYRPTQGPRCGGAGNRRNRYGRAVGGVAGHAESDVVRDSFPA